MTAPIQLQTERLRLVAGTEAMVQAELMDRVAMARLLGVAVPGTWPPPLNDDGSMRYFLRFAREHPEGIGFGCWYWMRDGDHDGRGGTSDGGGLLLIGNGGFKGLPSEDGTVEVGYSVLEGYQGQGYATEGVRALLAWAFRDARVRRVIAETLPDGAASRRVLAKNGFAQAAEPAAEAGAIRFALPRDAWERLHPQ